jgi:hypothetical protein
MSPALPVALLLAGGLTAVSTQPAQTFDAQRALLRPSDEELQFEQIPWRTELEGAVAEAREKRLPLVVWVMNGHPLGAT